MSSYLKYLNNGNIRWIGGIGHNMSFRKNGPCMIYEDGTVYFSQTNTQSYNRRAGPAKIYPHGAILYFDKHGGIHRTNGPAIILPSGSKEYWVHDSEMSPEEFFLKYGVM